MPSHDDVVRAQFTQQAEGYASAPLMKDEEHLRLLVALAGAGPSDTVLDVACGPGFVTCSFAAVACRAVGVDLTPAMVERAEATRRERGITNVEFRVGDVAALEFSSNAFTLAVSRYAFHHFPEPLRVLTEMLRVTAPGGRIVIADLAPPASSIALFNRMETLRDPSHARALTSSEFEELFRAVGLSGRRVGAYDFTVEVEELLRRAAPPENAAQAVREIFRKSLEGDALGMKVHRRDEAIWASYPVEIFVAPVPK